MIDIIDSNATANRVPAALALVRAAASGEATSREARDSALASIGHGTVARRLRSVADGETPVSFENPFYILGDADPALVNALQHAVTFLAEQGVPLGGGHIVDADIRGKEFAAAVSLDGCYYLCVSAESEEDLLASAVHELTHTVFTSGHRFLDEAAAYYFELQSRGAFPSQAIGEASYFLEDYIDVPTLLAYNASADPFFSQLVPDRPFAVHALGALFFHSLLKRKGLAEVMRLYRTASLGREPAQDIEYIRGWLDGDIESVHTLLGAPDTRSANDVMKLDYAGVEKAFLTGDLRALDGYRETVREQHRTRSVAAKELTEADILALCAVAITEAFESSLTPKEQAFVVSRVVQFTDAQGSDWPRIALYRAMIGLLNLPFEGSMLDAMLALDEAKLMLKRSLDKHPQDPVNIVFQSRLVWHSPSESTEDKKEAISLLRRLSDHHLYKGVIEQMIDMMSAALSAEVSK